MINSLEKYLHTIIISLHHNQVLIFLVIVYKPVLCLCKYNDELSKSIVKSFLLFTTVVIYKHIFILTN